MLQESGGLLKRGEEMVNVISKSRIGAALLEIALAFLGRELDDSVEDFADVLPRITRGHGLPRWVSS